MERIVLAVFLMFASSYQMQMEVLKNTLAPSFDPLNIEDSPTKKYLQNLHQKLTQHSQALEDLLKLNEKNEHLVKKLIENFSKLIDKPNTVKLLRPNRRNYTPQRKSDTPIISIVRFGKHIPRYGNLFLNLISNEIKNHIEPILEVMSSTELSVMRSFK